MTFSEYRYLILSDLYRVTGSAGISILIKSALWGGSFRYVFWMRTCLYLSKTPWLKYSIYPLAKYFLYRLTYKFGISIPPETPIGEGFYIGHFGGIVVNPCSRIGRNCNISHGVTLGQANRGRNKGYPVIGDNVYLGPGSKVIGAVTVGNNVAIGANCVVTKDVPDNSVVVGVPGRVISQEGSVGYINNTGYADSIR